MREVRISGELIKLWLTTGGEIGHLRMKQGIDERWLLKHAHLDCLDSAREPVLVLLFDNGLDPVGASFPCTIVIEKQFDVEQDLRERIVELEREGERLGARVKLEAKRASLRQSVLDVLAETARVLAQSTRDSVKEG